MFFGKKKDKSASPETSKSILGSTSIGSSATGSPIQQATQIFSSIHKIFLDAIEDEKLHNEKIIYNFNLWNVICFFWTEIENF